MSAWVVQVVFTDFDMDSQDRMYGPFASRETAEKFIGRLKLPEMPLGAQALVGVYARPIFPPKIRPIRRETNQFIKTMTEEER